MSRFTPICVACGEPISGEPVPAVLGDKVFASKRQEPFPLHRECFDANRKLTVTRWSGGDPDELVEFQTTRYREVI